MRRFSVDQKELFFLSPYTNILVREDHLIIEQRLFGMKDVVFIPRAMAEHLLCSLKKGISKEMLLSELNEAGIEQPEEMIFRWMQIGILE